MSKVKYRIIELPVTPDGCRQRLAITPKGVRHVDSSNELEGPLVTLEMLVKLRGMLPEGAALAKEFTDNYKKRMKTNQEIERMKNELEFLESKLDGLRLSLSRFQSDVSGYSVQFREEALKVGCKRMDYKQAPKVLSTLIAAVKRFGRSK